MLAEVEFRFLEDGDQVGQAVDSVLAFAQLVGVVEVGKVAARQLAVGLDERLDDLGVDPVADVVLAFQGHHVLERGALGDDDRWGKVVAVGVLVADEQHEQDIVLVLAGVHAATQFIARCPDGAVEV